ncbi:unnamed protein product [Brassica oleracea var. botrytis]
MPYALQLMAQFIELDNASSDDIMEICLSQDLDSENLAGLENLFVDFLDAIWIPSLKSIMGENHERKLAAVAATKVLGDLKYHQNPQAATRWGKMLNSVITLVLCPEKTEDVGDSENSLIIHNAIRKEDHAEGIKDPKEHLVHAVSHLSRLDHPGMLQSIIAENLDQPNKSLAFTHVSMSLSNTTTSTYGTLRYASKPRGPTGCPLSQLAENLKQLIYFDTKRTVQRKDGSFYSKREVR